MPLCAAGGGKLMISSSHDQSVPPLLEWYGRTLGYNTRSYALFAGNFGTLFSRHDRTSASLDDRNMPWVGGIQQLPPPCRLDAHKWAQSFGVP